MLSKSFSRRDALKLGLLGSASLLLPFERRAFTSGGGLNNRIASSKLPAPFSTAFTVPPTAKPKTKLTLPFQDGTKVEHDVYQIRQLMTDVEVLPGRKTKIFGYDGATPGPTIHCRRGRPILVQQCNELPTKNPELGTYGGYTSWTSTHLHGSASLPEYDGFASDIAQPANWDGKGAPAQYKNYHYPNIQDSRTLWYHDHGVHHTGENAYMGLAAQYQLHDDFELGLDPLAVPHGSYDAAGTFNASPYDLPLVIRDAMFADGGAGSAPLLFDNSSESGMYGDVVLVNGRPWPKLVVEPKKYRFRVLNASVSRSYRLQLDSGDPMTVIATDGGFMPAPQAAGDIRLGMAERYEIIIDFSKYNAPQYVGKKITLKNLLPPNNINYTNVDKIMQFEIGPLKSQSDAGHPIPAQLQAGREVNNFTGRVGAGAMDSKRERLFKFERSNGHWTVNGTTWEDVIASDYKYSLANPGRDEIETWVFQNNSGGWFHPVHVHLVDFKVVSRTGGKLTGADRNGVFPYEKGPKDVVYVGEGETVKVAMRFEHQSGRYMMHCHNLVHEDHDMMAQFWVGGDAKCLDKLAAKDATGPGAAAGAQCNPISADAARPEPVTLPA